MNPLLSHFGYEHLPPYLQSVARPFRELAERLVQSMPDPTIPLRKLLEARDAAVQAMTSPALPQVSRDPDLSGGG